MSSVFGILNTGSTGLTANGFGTSVASQNLSNVATPGYTRRIATLEPLGPRPLSGVRAQGSSRVIDPFLERRVLGNTSYQGESVATVGTLNILDVAFQDGPGTVGTSLDEFHAALADLSTHPSDLGVRQTVLQRAQQLATAFNQTAQQLAQARTDTNGRISLEVQDINLKLSNIAELGTSIAKSEAASGQEASDLRDRRDQLVREVAKTVPVTAIEQSDGQINLLLNGSLSLVRPDGTFEPLQATEDLTSGDIRIYRTTAGATEDVTNLIDSGTLGGYFQARDGALRTAQNNLDQLASDFATAYNGVHTAGFGLDGASGRNLFEPPAAVSGAALNLAVSTNVSGQPDRLGAATAAASTPGDNRNALALMDLRDTTYATAGTLTGHDAFASMVSAAGASLQSARSTETHATDTLTQVNALREATSGVSTDEEMVSLMQFQRAYQSSLRVVETADQMLAELVNLKR